MTRVLLFVTSHHSTNGYSYVGYEIARRLSKCTDIHLTVYGFQNFHTIANHRKDYPDNVYEYDAFANETVKQAGFGIEQVKDFVVANRPDICIVYNDVMILKSVITELKAAQSHNQFQIVAYVDQVYLCQKKEYIDFLNANVDYGLAFTPFWLACLRDQGFNRPLAVLKHGFNPQVHYPIPQALARRLYGLSPSDFLVMNLNRNQPRKRWDVCMQAWALVVSQAKNKPIKLLIGTSLQGAWNILEVYERELAKFGISLEEGMRHVVVLDFPQQLCDEDVNFLYNAADIGLNTCDGEGFGLCNFQQAAIGIPQVVPAIGGFLDFFDDTCAMMIQPRLTYYVDNSRDNVGGEAQLCDYRDFADAILRYYNDPKLREAHGKLCRERIVKDYSWDDIVQGLHEYINEISKVSKATEKVVDINEVIKVAEVAEETLEVPPKEAEVVTSKKKKKLSSRALLKKRLANGSVYSLQK